MSATNNKSDKDAIKGGGKAAKSKLTDKEILTQLIDRISALEEDLEASKQILRLQEKLEEYVNYLKAEIKEIKRFRFWITLMAIIFSLGLFSGFVYFSLCPPPWFSALEGSIKIPFLISLSVMSVLLMALCLRGVYQTRKERNYDDYLPESIKLAINAMGNNP